MKIEAALTVLNLICAVSAQPRYIYFEDETVALFGQYACTCVGGPAIVDTEEKQNYLLEKIDIPSGKCAWIGASTIVSSELQWNQILSNRTDQQLLNYHGPLVSETYSNFTGGIPDGVNRAVCIESDGTWRATDISDTRPTVCERLECGPGTYKQLAQPGGLDDISTFCAEDYGIDLCVECPAGTVKNVTGDSMSLCRVLCGFGMNNLPNNLSICACDAGYFKNGDVCTLCTGNTIKTAVSDATNCNTDPPCDGTSTVPNEGHTSCVCNAGYFKNGESCTLCTGDEIKPQAGNTGNCQTCGSTLVANSEHTACVCMPGYFKNGDSCSQCTGDGIKPQAGNATNCDSCYKISMVANAQHTACECAPGYYGTGVWCQLCPFNTIKSQPGNTNDCSMQCDFPNALHNPQHTACLCNCGYFKKGHSCTLCTGNTIKTSVSNATNCDADPPCDGTTKVPNEDHTACVDPPASPGCFPSTAKVFTENGRLLRMSEVQIGDKVQTGGSSSYSKVRAFLKKQPSMVTKYKSITTSSNEVISLSGNHLIYTRKRCTDKFHPRYADQVLLDDEVLVNKNDEFIPARVINISSLMIQGAYVPLTEEGSIVVDRVLASCYLSADHDLAHLTMAPLQWFPTLSEWIFGDDTGFSVFVGIVEQMGKLMLPYGHYFN